MPSSSVMPALFVGHGSPMNAIEDNAFHRSWAELGRRLPRPRAVLCVSAHWETRGVYVTGTSAPETIHDFYGFPAALFQVRYPAPGDPALARRIASLAEDAHVHVDAGRGLDHGAWSVLRAMYPKADIPVLQLSLDVRRSGTEHYRLAASLAPLRDEGILVLASGNIVHNLALFRFHSHEQPAWALRFRTEVNACIEQRDHRALCQYENLGPDAALAIPTPEHYLPLLYALALQRDGEAVQMFNDEVISALSMTSLIIGDV
ncbi:4,5-DOPA dioxygenase extradiol [Dyella subtropica]|uniref:4,5-DOPA-extradiol-dioxygenase n=1 Tax=Dyella subtropica TaxID=2992127 RepID=UPI002B1CB996|nr:4,5-DOPA dioxygenase extradiol [Dyella subtropica]